MIRGTTAQFKFKLKFPLSNLEWINITFWQPGNPTLEPIIKNKSHCAAVSGTTEVCTSLTCEETAMFSDKYKAKVQLRAQPVAELHEPPFGSKEQLITVYPMLDDLINKGDTPIEPSTPGTDDGLIEFDGGNII
jgi:hypothetical protein